MGSEQVQFDFSIGDQVTIKANELTGKVISLWQNQTGKQYEVEYCVTTGAITSRYFFAEELIEIVA